MDIGHAFRFSTRASIPRPEGARRRRRFFRSDVLRPRQFLAADWGQLLVLVWVVLVVLMLVVLVLVLLFVPTHGHMRRMLLCRIRRHVQVMVVRSCSDQSGYIQDMQIASLQVHQRKVHIASHQ